jgi:hypothetical protein
MKRRRHAERPPNERGLRILLLPYTHVRELSGWFKLALAGTTLIAVGALLTIDKFGWTEAAQLLVAAGCVRVIARSIETVPYASPFAEGTLLAVGAIWTALIALVNSLFYEAPTRDSIAIVLGCAAVFLAGMIIRVEEGRRWYEHDPAA